MCVTSTITVGPNLRLLPAAACVLGFRFGPCSWCGLHRDRRNDVLYSLFDRSHSNHTYHCRNPSPYRPSHYGSDSSSVSPSASFAWPRLGHSPAPHTPATVMGQANTQIWPPMSSPKHIASSTVTCIYSPRVARVAYDTRLLHGSKEDEVRFVLYMYNSPHRQSPLGICVLLISHHQYSFGLMT
jgi:hypothetical protein